MSLYNSIQVSILYSKQNKFSKQTIYFYFFIKQFVFLHILRQSPIRTGTQLLIKKCLAISTQTHALKLKQQMQLKNQTDLDTYHVSDQNGLFQQSSINGDGGFSNNPAWNQLLKWSKANPEIMMNYINYPLDQKDGINKESSFCQIQLQQKYKCPQFNGQISNEVLQEQNPAFKDEESQKLNFEMGEFDDVELDFDKKECIFDLSNQDNFESQFHNIEQIPKEDKQENEPFFKETFIQDSESNYIKPKKAYKQRININQRTNLQQSDYNNEKKWKKKMSIQQIKKSLFNSLTKEEECLILQKLEINQQIEYVENRIRHYNLLKSMIIKMKLKDDQSKKVATLSNKSRISRTVKERKNTLRTNEESTQSFSQKMKITPQLLRMLSGKFQLFNSYQMGKYDPGYKMSLASIANQFQLSSQRVSDLYNQWRRDRDFSNNKDIIQNPTSFVVKQGVNDQFSQDNIFTARPHTSKQQFLSPFNKVTNSNTILEMRKIFTERFRKLKSKGVNLYFLDECHKEMIMGTNRIEEQGQGQQINFSLMSLLGIKGRASWKVVRWLGQKYQQVNDIQQLYKNVRDDEEVDLNQIVKNNKSYLILDPAVVKSTEKAKRIQQMTNTKILFFPQFSKQLNPLQFWFTDVKGRLRMATKSLAELNRVLQKFSDTDFGKYLSDSERYMTFALQKVPF